ncbi:hypothetical protein G6F62_015191 [Rhizopus arrhizus]|nr:hypothetical protein G6F62_015191 [Rhizopus arrhizus]
MRHAVADIAERHALRRRQRHGHGHPFGLTGHGRVFARSQVTVVAQPARGLRIHAECGLHVLVAQADLPAVIAARAARQGPADHPSLTQFHQGAGADVRPDAAITG